MSATILKFILGPLENNSYILADNETGEAAIIDPSFGSGVMVEEAVRRGWKIQQLWLTHAHFDHVAGVKAILDAVKNQVGIFLHPDDLLLWKQMGNASQFGFSISPLPAPTNYLSQGQILQLGDTQVEVKHTPGHTPGHVVFVCPSIETVFCGDLIFQNSIGRTDLPGCDYDTLLNSIHTQILGLPPKTQLLSGHGPATTIADEIRENPFL